MRLMSSAATPTTTSIPQKTAELKTLRIAARGQMIVPPGLNQFEAQSKRP